MARARLWLDTNVYVLAVADPDCDSAALVRMAARGDLEVVVSDVLLKEATRTFRREFGRSSAGLARRMVARMPTTTTVWSFEWSHLTAEIQSLVSDKSDVDHVCAALVAQADAFVTEDLKLSKMPVRGRLRFITPRVARMEIEGP